MSSRDSLRVGRPILQHYVWRHWLTCLRAIGSRRRVIPGFQGWNFVSLWGGGIPMLTWAPPMQLWAPNAALSSPAALSVSQWRHAHGLAWVRRRTRPAYATKLFLSLKNGNMKNLPFCVSLKIHIHIFTCWILIYYLSNHLDSRLDQICLK